MASSGVPSATSQSGSSVAGSITSSVPPPAGVAPLAADVELVRDLLDDLLFFGGDAHVATVSVPSSSDIATSIE